MSTSIGFVRITLFFLMALNLLGQEPIIPRSGRLVHSPAAHIKQTSFDLGALFDHDTDQVDPQNRWKGNANGGQALRLLFDLGREVHVEQLTLHLEKNTKQNATMLIRVLGLSSHSKVPKLSERMTEKVGSNRTVILEMNSETGLRYLELEFYPAKGWHVLGLAEIQILGKQSKSEGVYHKEGLDHVLLDTPWIDRFGQYYRETWPEKILTDEQLRTEAVRDQSFRGEPSSLEGGTTGYDSGDFFRVGQTQGRFHLVDPLGQPFIAIGLNGVMNPLRSKNKNLPESLFVEEFYPPPDHFFLNNLDHKYGSDYSDEWRQSTWNRMHYLAFNTLGKWTPGRVGRSEENRYPYVITLRLKDPDVELLVRQGGGGAVANVFAPSFEEQVRKTVQKQINRLGTREDRRLIGYFVNNEEAWDWHLVSDLLSSPSAGNARQGLIQYLEDNFRDSPQKVLGRWGVKNARRAVKNPEKSMKLKGAPSSEAQVEMEGFIEAYAERYFEALAAAIKAADPNHLYLGNSMGWMWSPGALRACARHADVVSIDHYSSLFDERYFNRLREAIPNTPLLLAEFGFTQAGRGMGYKQEAIADGEARGKLYREFLEDASERPELVGLFYYTYKDDELAGKDGRFKKNRAFGFINTVDQLDSSFARAARTANLTMIKKVMDVDLLHDGDKK